MLSLPFSDTEYFKFNPESTPAQIIATLAFPFVVSFILCSSFGLTKRFGILSITGNHLYCCQLNYGIASKQIFGSNDSILHPKFYSNSSNGCITI